jgi:electron transfer flavoprotein alpha subunit
MSKILVVAEHDGRKLNPATAKCINAASQVSGATVQVLVVGGTADVAAAAAQISGVTGVWHRAADDAAPIAARLAPGILALVRSEAFSHVFGPSTTFGKDLMPRVAALLDAPQVSDLMAVEAANRFKRPIYAGNAIVTVDLGTEPVIVATVRVASFAAAPLAAATAPVTTLPEIDGLPQHTRFISLQGGNSERPDLQGATRVVSGGRALGSAENFALIQALADKLGAAVGASRAAVDAGYAPNELQVGQTGKIISPDLYIAFGISGAIQHMTGIKDAKTIVAINKDADAPIFEAADIGLVADLFEVLPALQQKIAG